MEIVKFVYENEETQNFIQACLRKAKKDTEMNEKLPIKKENSPFLFIKNE
jgi:hypothetical protein